MYDGPLFVIATRCHLSLRRSSFFFPKSYLLTQPFRMLARLAATSPFRGDIMVLRTFICSKRRSPLPPHYVRHLPQGAGKTNSFCTSQQILDTNHKKIYNKKLSVSQISVRNATCDIELASDSLTNKLDAVH